MPPKLPVILLTGAKGQLGFELQRSLALLGQVVAVDRQGCDLSRPEHIRAYVRSCQPQIIVNAAAYTAVDRAESEPEQAQAINATAVQVLTEEARALGAALVHYSTDYVFDGAQQAPYQESDIPQPLSVYGASKLAGEQAIQRTLRADDSPWWILRTSWVYGLHGKNFLKTMLRLAVQRDSLSVVSDQIGSPTSAALLADITAHLLRQRPASGLYNLAATGATSWHGYARHVIARAQEAGLKTLVSADAIKAIPTSAYPLPASRPANSRLRCDKLQAALKVSLPDWTLAVNQTLDLLLENRSL